MNYIDTVIAEFRKEFLMKGSECTWENYPNPEEIESFIKSKLEEQAKRYEACVPEKMVNTKMEENSDWFYGYGFNAALDTIRKNMESLDSNKSDTE